ncbi:efflux RND transporter periplasmic adaptor subunit [Cytobacillus sp. Hz8]|uniref:efflux RND transporter periplasmic adaptor subunit n=1 Tax=Cytobacillus sp. Hz8 TaxID=3347168 RepID=UPI0035DC7FE7
MKKWIINIVIVVLIIGIGGGTYYFINKKNESKNTVVAQTQTAIAEKGDVTVTVSGTGNISAIHKEILTAKKNGTVNKVHVSEGDTVEEGDDLITFNGDINPIEAPFSGEITSLNVEENQNVSPATELVGITNYNNLEMIVNIDELDISKVKVGQKAKVEVSALPDKTFTGTVTSVAKEANEDSDSSVAKFAVHVKISNPKGIKIGMTAEATITTNSKNDVLTVPIEAVQKQGDKYYVRIADAQESKTIKSKNESSGSDSQLGPQTQRTQQEVEVGLQNDEVAEIISGLAEGDEVILPSISSDSSTSKVQQGGFPGGGMRKGGNLQSQGGSFGGSQGGNNK